MSVHENNKSGSRLTGVISDTEQNLSRINFRLGQDVEITIFPSLKSGLRQVSGPTTCVVGVLCCCILSA